MRSRPRGKALSHGLLMDGLALLFGVLFPAVPVLLCLLFGCCSHTTARCFSRF
jgi:hypothetical protein